MLCKKNVFLDCVSELYVWTVPPSLLLLPQCCWKADYWNSLACDVTMGGINGLEVLRLRFLLLKLLENICVYGLRCRNSEAENLWRTSEATVQQKTSSKTLDCICPTGARGRASFTFPPTNKAPVPAVTLEAAEIPEPMWALKEGARWHHLPVPRREEKKKQKNKGARDENETSGDVWIAAGRLCASPNTPDSSVFLRVWTENRTELKVKTPLCYCFFVCFDKVRKMATRTDLD